MNPTATFARLRNAAKTTRTETAADSTVKSIEARPPKARPSRRQRIAVIIVREVLLMHSSASRSFLSMAAWFCLGPFVAIAVLALLVLGFGALAVAAQLIAVLLKHAGV